MHYYSEYAHITFLPTTLTKYSCPARRGGCMRGGHAAGAELAASRTSSTASAVRANTDVPVRENQECAVEG